MSLIPIQFRLFVFAQKLRQCCNELLRYWWKMINFVRIQIYFGEIRNCEWNIMTDYCFASIKVQLSENMIWSSKISLIKKDYLVLFFRLMKLLPLIHRSSVSQDRSADHFIQSFRGNFFRSKICNIWPNLAICWKKLKRSDM